MKPENDFSRAFINLANMGRIDWRSVILTYLLVKFLSFLFTLTSAIVVTSPIFSEHRLFHIPVADRTPIFRVVDAAAYIFGFWLACKKILRRPFLSLISTDLTFDIRRCLRGAALYLAANAISFMAISLFTSMRAGVWVIAPRHFEWPHHRDQIVIAMVNLFVIPFAAFAEELFFRAWLTQTIGRYIRSTIVVVALVAVIFAAFHTQYDLRMKTLIFVDSLGFSALSLRDQRLELVIGVHSMMNVCVALQLLFFTGPLPHAQIPATPFDFWSLLILKCVLPIALMYGVLQKTRGWFVPTDARLTSSGNLQPGHL
ncbi:CPBP family glutamic-type intramembrane protease [Paraburkholderia acidicola]|uniref:CPBP family glutamic-type intramembrane protease n=1 Tax=Paraburkholderia acidicola TaxID=1912599 RepID=A0ABV1LNI1_9BURK